MFSVTGGHLLIPLNENLSQWCVFPHLQRRTVNTIRSVTSDLVTLYTSPAVTPFVCKPWRGAVAHRLLVPAPCSPGRPTCRCSKHLPSPGRHFLLVLSPRLLLSSRTCLMTGSRGTLESQVTRGLSCDLWSLFRLLSLPLHFPWIIASWKVTFG